jgi:hypothetical protein
MPEASPTKKKLRRRRSRGAITNVDIWQIIGVLLGVIAATATLTIWIQNKLDNNLRGTSQEDFWKLAESRNITLEDSLQHFLGEPNGDIVYQGLVKRFEDRNIMPSQKQSMKYHITISDSPPSNLNLGEPLLNGEYYFIESDLNFAKVISSPLDEVVIAAITEPNELAKWLRKKDVIFREVIGVNERDQLWFKNLLDAMNKARDPQERLKISNQIFRIDFQINNIQVDPIDLRREAFGLSIVYKVPRGINWQDPVQFEFRYIFVQPKKLTSFPIVITDPTQNLDVRFDYSRASLRNLNYFRAFFIGDGDNPSIDLDRGNSILQIKSIKGDEWIFPGGGVMIYWSQH